MARNTKKLAETVLKEAERDLDKLRGTKFTIEGVREVVKYLVKRIEWQAIVADLRGADKRALAIEVALLLLSRYAPSGWLKIAPSFILRFIIGRMVDQVVKMYNRTVGKKWGKTI